MYDAVSHFNIGSITVIKLFQALGTPPGKYTEEGCRLQDQLRVHVAQQKQDDLQEEKKSHQRPKEEER